MNETNVISEKTPAVTSGEQETLCSCEKTGDQPHPRCWEKATAACRNMCDRFLRTKVCLSYRMTMTFRSSSVEQDVPVATAQGQSQAMNAAEKLPYEVPCTMSKDGTLELKAFDVAAGLLLTCVITSLVLAIKNGCCRR